MLPRIMVVVISLSFTAAASATVRVTCEGIHEMSRHAPQVSCSERSLLTDDDGGFIPGLTAAMASLEQGALVARASGGAIRDAGYNGGEATAVLIDTVRLNGDWEGEIPVTVHVKLDYVLVGRGQSRLNALLITSRADLMSSRAEVKISHENNHRSLETESSGAGRFEVKENPEENEHAIAFAVTEMIDASSPTLRIMLHIASVSMPNLRVLQPHTAALATAQARVLVTVPPTLSFESESGHFLVGTPAPPRGKRWSRP